MVYPKKNPAKKNNGVLWALQNRKDYFCISSPTFSTSWPAPCHVLAQADKPIVPAAIVRASNSMLSDFFIIFSFPILNETRFSDYWLNASTLVASMYV